jgi:hypothetical protein
LFDTDNIVGCCEDTDAWDELAGCIDDVERVIEPIEPIEPIDLELAPTNIESAIPETVVGDATALSV